MFDDSQAKTEEQPRAQPSTANEDYRDWFENEMSRIRFDLYKVADACLKAGDDAARDILHAMATIVLEFAEARDAVLNATAKK